MREDDLLNNQPVDFGGFLMIQNVFQLVLGWMIAEDTKLLLIIIIILVIVSLKIH